MTTGKKVKKASQEDFVRSKPRVRLTTGEILAILREKNELTQNELAQKADLTQATISSLESNRISLGVERAKALAKVLHVHPAVLLFPDWEHGERAA
jgi:transcriptional regulator with XRE-family HTH domain